MEVFSPRKTHATETKRYEETFERVCDEALLFFKSMPPTHTRPSAVVFDIDGTILDDRRSKQISQYDYFPAHECMRRVYRKVALRDYDIFFVTARSPNWTDRTIRNLVNEGFGIYTTISYCPIERSRTAFEIGKYKEEMRQRISQSHHIVACIGDQPSDVEGQFIGDRQFKLPSPPSHEWL